MAGELCHDWKCWRKRRYMVSIMACFGFFNVYAMRINLSIAIVDMTALKNITLNNGTTISYREFDWDSTLQGYVLSSFFYGYITTQIIGGYLASKFGGRKIFGAGIAVTGLLTLVTPLASNVSVYLLIAVRIVEGIFEGVSYPSTHEIWSRWAPPLERSRLATIAFSGSYIGTVVSMPLSAYLATAFGWPSIFYYFGSIALVWYVIWMYTTFDSPEQDSWISKEELDYITQYVDTKSKNDLGNVPWKSILTSIPVWAIIASHVSENWGWYTLITQLPKFMSFWEMRGSCPPFPYLVMAITIQFSGQLADCCLVRGYMTTTQVRRVFNCGAFIAQTVFMLSAAFWMTPVGGVFCLTMAVALGAFAWAGFSINHLDIAPQYASILMGLTNTFATLPGIISPILTGYIVTDETSADEWRPVFYITAGLYLFGALIYGTFASGELQSWAMESLDETEESRNAKKVDYYNKSFDADE
ncbi:hypothetical protein NQ318_020244 [Aromia moschata]|uniref:Sialin n=1 Tax=Aromia moschata TaxID=1265417 RepID=A0AAV8Z9Q2_9CUCU|nr:hypothetical protein NQ318_020244 [Aromia moschata]